jgi:hypothetical protein
MTKKKNKHSKTIARLDALKQINLNAAGIDVGDSEMYVAVPEDRDEHFLRVFGTFTRDLVAIAQWLMQCNVTTVAMESTGVYWIPYSKSSSSTNLKSSWSMHGKLKMFPEEKQTSKTAGGFNNSIPMDCSMVPLFPIKTFVLCVI